MAFKCFDEAALQGNCPAIYGLATLYEEGKGVKQYVHVLQYV